MRTSPKSSHHRRLSMLSKCCGSTRDSSWTVQQLPGHINAYEVVLLISLRQEAVAVGSCMPSRSTHAAERGLD